MINAKDKIERNVRLAEAAFAASPDELNRIEFARSLSSTNRNEETLEHLRVLRTSGSTARHTALHLGVKVLARMGALDEALEWAEEIRALGLPTVAAAKMHGEVLIRLGRHEDALDVLEEAAGDDSGIGLHGTHETHATVQALRVRVLTTLGREDEAADLAVSFAASAPDTLWPEMIALLLRRGELERAVAPFFDGLEQLGQTRARGVLAELSKQPVGLGDAFVEVLAAHPGGLPYALAFVLANADRFSLERACAWSAVAREAGLLDSCPLVHQMEAAHLPASQRFTAAAMALGTFGDERGGPALERAAADLSEDLLNDALYIVSEIAPQAFGDLIAGFVTSQRLALTVADALLALDSTGELVGLDAGEAAVAVLRHGLQVGEADPERDAVINASIRQLELLGQVASTRTA